MSDFELFSNLSQPKPKPNPTITLALALALSLILTQTPNPFCEVTGWYLRSILSTSGRHDQGATRLSFLPVVKKSSPRRVHRGRSTNVHHGEAVKPLKMYRYEWHHGSCRMLCCERR